jgi:hypothetical protein
VVHTVVSGAEQCMCSAVACSTVEWCMQWCGVVQWNSAVHAVVCGAYSNVVLGNGAGQCLCM